MTQPIIEVQNLSKRYRLGVVGATTLRDDAARLWQQLRGKTPPAADDDFWALRDVSFSIHPGEVVGILGRNGAGKSTLLKILSRVTEPTSGRAILRGRAASLLEVGTGFHPDLTGRENVYLNGAILGMKRHEITARFDEIVAFAEVEKFIDTPVKHYSSGMRVRLAFAVAAHLRVEIMIADEVLAVGDIDFQRKCFTKMESLAKEEGRSIMFVSHDTKAIERLCTTALWLEKSRIRQRGPVRDVATAYIAESTTDDTRFRLRHTSKSIQLRDVEIPSAIIRSDEPLLVHTFWQVNEPMRFGVECVLRDAVLTPLSFYGTGVLERFEFDAPVGLHRVTLRWHALPLAEGTYTIDIMAAESFRRFHVYAESAVRFEVSHSDPCRSDSRYIQGNGSVFLPLTIVAEMPRVPALPQRD
jgi:lipopolysaccharide transport system ATP-binding protein